MPKNTTIWTDSETLEKLRAMAPGGNVSAYLRSIASGKDGTGGLTHKDLAIQIGASQSAILKRLGEMDALIQAKKHDVNKS